MCFELRTGVESLVSWFQDEDLPQHLPHLHTLRLRFPRPMPFQLSCGLVTLSRTRIVSSLQSPAFRRSLRVCTFSIPRFCCLCSKAEPIPLPPRSEPSHSVSVCAQTLLSPVSRPREPSSPAAVPPTEASLPGHSRAVCISSPTPPPAVSATGRGNPIPRRSWWEHPSFPHLGSLLPCCATAFIASPLSLFPLSDPVADFLHGTGTPLPLLQLCLPSTSDLCGADIHSHLGPHLAQRVAVRRSCAR